MFTIAMESFNDIFTSLRKSGNGERPTGGTYPPRPKAEVDEVELNAGWRLARLNGEQENWGNGRLGRLNGIQFTSFSTSTNSVEIETLIDPDAVLPGETVTHLYNNIGEAVGQEKNGVTKRTDTTYELLSNVLWRVTTQTATGGLPSSAAATVGCDAPIAPPVGADHRTARAATTGGLLSPTAAGDTTVWAFDPATGNCTSKTYADGSTNVYTYASDGKPLRTTYASGRWRENGYNAKRELSSVAYSDGETCTFDYDEFSNEIASSNSNAFVQLFRNDYGQATNETTTVGCDDPVAPQGVPPSSATVTRSFDAFGRMTRTGDTSYAYASDGQLSSISNSLACVEYLYTPDRLDAGCTLTLSNGVTFTRFLSRDAYRRSLVTNITNSVNGNPIGAILYTYDALNRPVTRTGGMGVSPVQDTFGYNDRSEVVLVSKPGGSPYTANTYSYDDIGNLLASYNLNGANEYTANNLNQYTSAYSEGLLPLDPQYDSENNIIFDGNFFFTYDDDGNILSDYHYVFTYDAANRLKTVSTNGVTIMTNFYDAKSRRVRKITPEYTSTFFYDGWDLIEERIAYTNGTSTTIHYHWGKDLSGTIGGAGGVGGLLYLTVSNSSTPQLYIPYYDNNGNIMGYWDEQGNVVAEYTYDAFGNIVGQTGAMAGTFSLRFSTKYFDSETGLYYYGYRYYSPILMRWLTRDPIEESGGVNLYAMCGNNAVDRIDYLGLYLWYIIYYNEETIINNFQRAAETCMRNIKQSRMYNHKLDKIEMYGVRTADDFFNIWLFMNMQSRKQTACPTRFQIRGLYIYTHSGSDQLYLYESSAYSYQIKKLPLLNWAPNAEIHCFGCNSGLENNAGDSIAGSFFESQRISTFGQAGASTFSGNPRKKSKLGVVLNLSDVYLLSFDNNGNVIPPIRYPKKEIVEP